MQTYSHLMILLKNTSQLLLTKQYKGLETVVDFLKKLVLKKI